MPLSLDDVRWKSRFQVRDGEAAKVVKMRRGKRRLFDKADKVYVSSASCASFDVSIKLTLLKVDTRFPLYAYPTVKTTLTARIAWKAVVTTSARDSILKSFVWISRDGFFYFGISNSRHEKEDRQMGGLVWRYDGDRKENGLIINHKLLIFGSCGLQLYRMNHFGQSRWHRQFYPDW